MKSIAFVGLMGSGKTTLAKKFANEYEARKIAFADPLKIDVVKYKLIKGKSIDKSRDRLLLQNYGQLRRGELGGFEYHNGFVFRINNYAHITYKKEKKVKDIGLCHSTYWVDLLVNDFNKHKKSMHVNDDARRKNEVESLKNLDFLIVKVNIDENIRISRLRERDGKVNSELFNDISETEIDSLPYDVSINNNDTFESTWNTLLRLI